MNDCQDRPTLLPEAIWKALMNLPALRYMKAPVDTVAQLYQKYPIGNEKGTFAFVHDENTFYTYHPRGILRGRWKPIAGGLESFFEIDTEFLKEGDILVYDNSKQKFVVKSGNVWNKLLSGISNTFSQVTKFLNLVDAIPTDTSEAGVYFVINETATALYLVIGDKSRKIFNSSDYYITSVIDEKLKELIENINNRLDHQDELINNISSLGIKKTYQTYVDMQADVNNPIGDDLNQIKNGQLVSVINNTDLSKNGIYAYTIIDNQKTWKYRGSFGEVGIQSYEKADPLYIYRIDDAEGRLLIGILKNGTIVPTKLDLPSSVWNEIYAAINNAKSHLSEQDSKDNIYEIKDKDNRVLFAISKQGYLYSPKNVMYTKRVLDKYLYALYDVDDRLLLSIAKDGTFAPEKLKLPKNTLHDIDRLIAERIVNDYSNESNISLPLPRSIARVNILGNLYGITKDNSVLVWLEYWDYQGNYFKKRAKLSYQGSSSMAFDKKNFSIDLLNEDGSDFYVKFGDWISAESFHFKANWIDFTHARNIVCARYAYKLAKMRPSGQQFGWEKPYDPSNSILQERFDTGARGVIDGFPIEIYLNGRYQGVYTWNLKKHRSNYMMAKNNPKQIHIEMGKQAILSYPVSWEAWEIRTPKGFEENAEPPAGEVKTSIERFFKWCGEVTVDTFRATYKDYANINTWIDYVILFDMFCAWDWHARNTQLCTWDGKVWSTQIYDNDTVLGLDWNGAKLTAYDYFPEPQNVFKIMKTAMKTEVESRYKEIRDNGIFSIADVEKSYSKFMNVVGYEAYKRDADRWKNIPSNSECYTGITQVVDWHSKRLPLLDEKYNYIK